MKFFKSIIIFNMLLITILLVGCNAEDIEETETNEDIYQDLIYSLHLGDFENVYEDDFSEELQETISLRELERDWEALATNNGDLVGIRTLRLDTNEENLEIFEARVEYEDVNFDVRMILNESKEVVGFNLLNAMARVTIPNLVVEESIIVGEDTDFKLGGTITLPRYHQENLPAVILVHGSGPVDRDESVMAYKPFRDIAWGLAEQGIAVVRYDKRTFVYGEEMGQESDVITVYEETIQDAINAAELIKDDERINENNVFIIGHSLGGMLAPRIDEEGGDFAGIISLAGSPRPLWEIIYDQNVYFKDIYLTDENEKNIYMESIEEEYEKVQNLQNLSIEEAKDIEIFGINGYYLKDMEEYDLESRVTNLEKPILKLQGEDDFQVFYNEDFALWQELLGQKDNATLISYENLNHFFIEYNGNNKGTLEEYQHPGIVSQEVVTDIGKWISENLN